MGLVNTIPPPIYKYKPRGKKRDYKRTFIYTSEPKKFRYCWTCRRIIPSNEKFITAMGDVFHGRVVMGVLCIDCMCEIIYQMDPKILRKKVVKNIIARQVARKV